MLIDTHKASLKYITELGSVYVMLKKFDKKLFFIHEDAFLIHIDVFELNLSFLSNPLFFL